MRILSYCVKVNEAQYKNLVKDLLKHGFYWESGGIPPRYLEDFNYLFITGINSNENKYRKVLTRGSNKDPYYPNELILEVDINFINKYVLQKHSYTSTNN